jgi:hypothetical protein
MNLHLDQVRKFSLRVHFIWLLPGALSWGGREVWQFKQTGFLSAFVIFKGLLILFLASAVYAAACRRRPAFSFLGFFPLLWLALSRFQWDICTQPDQRYWIWIAIFLMGEFFFFALTDGRKLLAVLAPIWTLLVVIFPFSFFNFLSFGWVRENRFLKKSKWVCVGVPLMGLAGWLILAGWSSVQFFWLSLFQVFLNDLFISFFFLGWLGAMSFATRKISWVPAFGPLFLLPLGFILLPRPDVFNPLSEDLLKWVLVFFAGFGWESFRRDVMDRSWHGRLLWLVLGIAFFGGVL